MSQHLHSFVTLLRGINVGGNNIIKMSDLKTCFESMGFTDVVTFIQSGNVIFKSSENDVDSLTAHIEKVLLKYFGILLLVVTVSHEDLKETVKNAPSHFGTDALKYRCDVIFLKKPLTPPDAFKQIRINPEVDTVKAGKRVLYFSRLSEKAAQSRLSRIIGTPMYQNMTIRNWNTTTKLLALMEK